MATILALAGAAGAAMTSGCAEVEGREFDKLSTDVKNLQVYVKNEHEMQAHLYNELSRNFTNLVNKVTELETLVRGMQVTVSRLEDQLNAVLAAPHPAPPDGPRAEPPRKNEKLEDIQLRIERTLGELRQGKLKAEEAAPLLMAYSVHAAPKILDELAGAVTNFDYAKQLEMILGKFPADSLKTPLQKALTEAPLRQSAARVIGQTKDPALGKLLESHTEAKDEDFKLTVGESLVLCRNAKGIPILIVSLRSREATTRTIAIAALKRLARGQDFGYRPQASNDINADALKSWEEWYEKGGKAIFD